MHLKSLIHRFLKISWTFLLEAYMSFPLSDYLSASTHVLQALYLGLHLWIFLDILQILQFSQNYSRPSYHGSIFLN